MSDPMQELAARSLAWLDLLAEIASVIGHGIARACMYAGVFPETVTIEYDPSKALLTCITLKFESWEAGQMFISRFEPWLKAYEQRQPDHTATHQLSSGGLVTIRVEMLGIEPPREETDHG